MKKSKKVFSLITAISLLLPSIFIPLSVSAASSVNLTSTVAPNGEYVRLNWNVPDTSQKYTYQVFQKKPSDSVFQTIPAKESVRVLNVYPNAGDNINFTTYKGENLTLPRSASLKMWMEAPNTENSKGYGKGLISVDPVDLVAFGNNPNNYLKNVDGSWKYDAVFFGSWDCNGSCNNQGDFSTAARDALIPFVESGRGILFGHDTIYNGHPNMMYFRNYLNIKYSGADIPVVKGAPVTEKIFINKKGSLNNYPWVIGDIGSVLSIPGTHTSDQIAFGDIWMQFGDASASIGETYTDNSTGRTGFGNFYLTTWNNTAMIQTGHSNGLATADEQKILANTLFYLSQITDETKWDDRMGQDVSAPSQPVITDATLRGSDVQVKFNPATDNGLTYQYYVEATGGTNGTKVTSNIVSAEVKSGLKGYSIVVDNDPTTIPDANIETTNTQYNMNTNQTGKLYVHVVAVDNAGNKSEASHFLIQEKNAPSINHTLTPSSVTNQNVEINVVATDRDSGVSGMQIVDTSVRGLNGKYYAHVYDPGVKPPVNKGNLIMERIDPKINFNWGMGTPDLSVQDEFFNVEWTGLIYAPETGKYTFGIEADDGKILEINNERIIDEWVQGSGYDEGTITLEGGKWYPIHLEYYENAGAAAVALYWRHGNETSNQTVPTENLTPITNWVNGDTINKVVTENGKHLFAAKDNAGNVSVYEVNITSIDRIAPSAPTLRADNTMPTNQNVTVIIDYPTDAYQKQYKKGENDTWVEYVDPIALSQNGTVFARSIDQAGNESSVSQIAINNIDKIAPTTPTILTSGNEISIVPGVDDESGVELTMFQINNGSWEIYTNVKLLPDGDYTFKAKTVDKVGNVSEVVMLTKVFYAEALEVAMDAVNTVEKNKVKVELDRAKELVNKLPASPEKDELIAKLQQIQFEIDYEELQNKIKILSERINQGEITLVDLDELQDQISQLPDGELKDQLQQKLDEAKVAQELLDKAIAEVVKAEQTKSEAQINVAREIVNKLPNGQVKENLLKRLEEIEKEIKSIDIDPVDSIENIKNASVKKLLLNVESYINIGEKFKTRSTIINAIDKVEGIPQDVRNNTAYQGIVRGFEIRVEKLKLDYNGGIQDQINDGALKKATSYVEYYEKYRSAYYKSKAEEYVSVLPDGDIKDGLQARINAVILK